MKNYNSIAIDKIFKDTEVFDALAKLALNKALNQFSGHVTLAEVIEAFNDAFDAAASKHLVEKILQKEIKGKISSTKSVEVQSSSEAQSIIAHLTAIQYMDQIQSMFSKIGMNDFVGAEKIYNALFLFSKAIDPKFTEDRFQSYIITIYPNPKPSNWHAVYNIKTCAKNQRTHDRLQLTLSKKPATKRKIKKI